MPSIEKTQANLPLPEQPPVASDWNSADARTVNVGAGGRSEDLTHDGLGSDTLRSPATADSAVRTDGEALKTNTAIGAGRQAKEGLSGIPNDAVPRGSKNKAGLEDTTNKDFGYPQKNDPSSGTK
ncbi:hypothetical protein K491DRAFT_705094 [Lophiostoma macrostomum CBS 122681]|uniref:Uncharacterized protein n=1 Tax=Lophiostoma macrostomum CBS 122681 TaxID=1314788 RepID=A0A6A6T5X7_9PLEO|nr:hypothetical protein K491DRAFT_705094 [Lophiostoma macrostomum CBS 122681]